MDLRPRGQRLLHGVILALDALLNVQCTALNKRGPSSNERPRKVYDIASFLSKLICQQNSSCQAGKLKTLSQLVLENAFSGVCDVPITPFRKHAAVNIIPLRTSGKESSGPSIDLGRDHLRVHGGVPATLVIVPTHTPTAHPNGIFELSLYISRPLYLSLFLGVDHINLAIDYWLHKLDGVIDHVFTGKDDRRMSCRCVRSKEDKEVREPV